MLSLKTLFRFLVRTLLTFVLLGVVTFAFFSQTAEYAVTSREFNNAARAYFGIGTAELAPPYATPIPAMPFYINTDPRMPPFLASDKAIEFLRTLRYQPLTQAQIGDITSLPYITSVDKRYMTAGISDTYYRMDESSLFYNYTSRWVVEATLEKVMYGQPREDSMSVNDIGSYNKLNLKDCTLLAGDPAWPFEEISILAYYQKTDQFDGVWAENRCSAVYTPDYVYDTEYVKNMTMGSRYVFVIRYEPKDIANSGQYGYLSDHLSEHWCTSVWPLDGEPENYLETDRFAPLRELIEITDADMNTFDMVYTEDMRSILRFAEGTMVIVDGRTLTPEDSADGLYVCVVSRELAKANKLVVGDSVTMKLGTELFEQYKGLGAVAGSRERYKPAEKTVTLEIVGIYADTDGTDQQAKKPNWCYSVNTILVPKSLMPVPENQLTAHVFTPAEFSFKVRNAWNLNDFLEETAPRFEQMGYKLIFDDGGWPDIAQGFEDAKQLSLIKIAVMSAAVAAATGFIVYLFIGRKKKEYAVMRALGTPRKRAARALLLPLMAVAAAAVLIGSAAAWIYTIRTVAHNNTLSMMKEYAVSTAIPAEAVIGCIFGEMLLTLFFGLVLLRRIGKLSPLSLLQDNGNGRKRGKMNARREKPINIEKSSPATAISPALRVASTHAEDADWPGVSGLIYKAHKSRSFGFVLRYIGRHMRRSVGKSALAVLLAALLFAAVGQLALMKASYYDLCTNTVIKANFVGGLKLSAVPQLLRAGFVEEPYYEERERVDFNLSSAEIVFTNDIAHCTGEEADITYADGYDATCMEKLGGVMIAGKTLMAMYGLEPGDTVRITPDGWYVLIQRGIINTYRARYPAEDITDAEILTLYQSDLESRIGFTSRTYKIVGVITTPSGAYDGLAFTSGLAEGPVGFASEVKLGVAEFTLADNFKADAFRDYAKKLTGEGATGDVSLIMDTGKLEPLMNALRLMETMYPIALTAALLIGGFLCCLVIVQSSKEAAIMRVLGTTKRKTRTILALEQVLLSIAGLLIGTGGLLAYKATALGAISGQLSLYAALYFAVILISAIICSSLATRRNVLELLQTKE